MAKDAYWFKHDANARHDPKILILRARFGEAGYSRYFMVVEMMREAHGYKLKVDDYIYSIIGLDLGIPPDEAKRFVDSCVEIGLFFKDEFLYSTSLLRRMEEKDRLSDIRKQNASKRGSKTEANDIAKPEQTDPIRVEESRVEENREEKKKRHHFVRPTIQEVSSYCEERKNGINPHKWMAHYESNGWIVGKTPMKDWKATVRTWELSEYNTASAPKVDTPKRTDPYEEQLDFQRQANFVKQFKDKYLPDGVCEFCHEKADLGGDCICKEYKDRFADFKGKNNITRFR